MRHETAKVSFVKVSETKRLEIKFEMKYVLLEPHENMTKKQTAKIKAI